MCCNFSEAVLEPGLSRDETTKPRTSAFAVARAKLQRVWQGPWAMLGQQDM